MPRKILDFNFTVSDNNLDSCRRIAIQVFIERKLEVFDELGLVLA